MSQDVVFFEDNFPFKNSDVYLSYFSSPLSSLPILPLVFFGDVHAPTVFAFVVSITGLQPD